MVCSSGFPQLSGLSFGPRRGKREEAGVTLYRKSRTNLHYSTVLRRIGSFGEGGGACATLSKSPYGLSVGLYPRYRRGAQPLSAASSFTVKATPEYTFDF